MVTDWMSVSVSIMDLYTAESWSTSTALCVLSSDCLKLLMVSAGSQRLSGSEFQTIGPATEKARQPKVPSWYRGMVRWCRVEWLTVNDVGWECPRLVYSSWLGTPEPCTADSDALWLPVCSGYILGRRASAAPHAASDKLSCFDAVNVLLLIMCCRPKRTSSGDWPQRSCCCRSIRSCLQLARLEVNTYSPVTLSHLLSVFAVWCYASMQSLCVHHVHTYILWKRINIT